MVPGVLRIEFEEERVSVWIPHVKVASSVPFALEVQPLRIFANIEARIPAGVQMKEAWAAGGLEFLEIACSTNPGYHWMARLKGIVMPLESSCRRKKSQDLGLPWEALVV